MLGTELRSGVPNESAQIPEVDPQAEIVNEQIWL